MHQITRRQKKQKVIKEKLGDDNTWKVEKQQLTKALEAEKEKEAELQRDLAKLQQKVDAPDDSAEVMKIMPEAQLESLKQFRELQLSKVEGT